MTRSLGVNVIVRQLEAFMGNAIDIRRRGAANFTATINTWFPVAKIIHQDQNNIRLAPTYGRSQSEWNRYDKDKQMNRDFRNSNIPEHKSLLWRFFKYKECERRLQELLFRLFSG